MTTFSELREEVLNAIGNRHDPASITWADRSINAAILAAALQFEPPELRTSGSLTALTSQDYISMTSLTRLLRIEDVYNITGACNVYPIKFHRRKVLWLPTSGPVQYYSEYGSVMYFSPTPSEDNVLTVRYMQYPTRLSADEDVYPFATLEDFVLALSLAMTFTFLEEAESSSAWLSLSGSLGIPESVISIVRRYAKGEINDDYIQRAVQQSSSPS